MGVGSSGETSFLRNCCPRDASACVLGAPYARSATALARCSQDPGEELLLAKGGKGPLPVYSEPCVRWMSQRIPGSMVLCRFPAGSNWGQPYQALSLQGCWQKPQEPVAELVCRRSSSSDLETGRLVRCGSERFEAAYCGQR